MKFNYIIGSLYVLLLSSCVDSNYSFDDDRLSTEVNFGGDSLGVNLGSSINSTLNSILKLDETDNLTTDEIGNYLLTKKQELDPIVYNIDEIDIAAIYVGVLDLDLDIQAFEDQDTSIPYTENISFKSVTNSIEINISKEISQSEISTIERVLFAKESSNYPSLKADVKFSGFPAPISEESHYVEITSLKVELPDHIVTQSTETTTTFSQKVELSQSSDGSYEGVMPIDIPVAALINSSSSKNISISEDIIFELDFTINSIGQQSSDYIDEDELKISLSIEDIYLSSASTDQSLSVSEVTGKFAYTIYYEKDIDGLELPEALSSDETVLDLIHSAIATDITSNLPIPVDLDIDLKPILESGYTDSSEEVSITGITVEADSNQRYWCSDDTSYMSVGDIFNSAVISPIINCKPEIININVKASIDETQSYTIPVGSHDVDIEVDIIAPLQIGSKMNIVYQLEDALELGDIGDYLNSIELTVSGTNNIPLNTSLTASAVDSDYKEIDGVDITSTGELKSTIETSSEDSSVVLYLTETQDGALSLAEYLILSITFSSSDEIANQYLNENQTLQLEFSVKIPGGLNLDLDEL